MLQFARNKIELYVERTFGEKFSATFDFLSDNWKVLLKYVTCAILPFCLVIAMGLSDYASIVGTFSVGDEPDMDYMRYGVTFILIFVMSVVSSVLLMAVVHSILWVYFDRLEGLRGISWQDLKPVFFRCLKRAAALVLSVGFIGVVVALVCMALAVISPLLLVPALVALFVCAVPLAILAPAYLLEEGTLFQAFAKAYRLGFKTWGGIFMLVLVVGLIIYLLQLVFSFPWTLCVMARSVFAVVETGQETGDFAGSNFLTCIIYLAGIASSYVSMLGSSVMFVAMAYLYGHAAEKIDGVSLKWEVDEFESLADDDGYGQWESDGEEAGEGSSDL